MKSSIVLATYNGEKYILELLDSLNNQTREVDEVIILDDCSEDNTYELISDYVESHSLRKWKIYRNSYNVGWKKNFMKGVSIAKGEIVFFCDQDDIWHIDKIRKMMNIFETNDNIGVLVTDYSVADKSNWKLQKILTMGKLDIDKVMFDKQYYRIKRAGFVMAINKRLLSNWNNLWQENTPHDAFFWTMGNILGVLYYMRESLAVHRLHSSNETYKISHELNYKIDEAVRTSKINLWYLASKETDNDKKKIIIRNEKWCQLRIGLLVCNKFSNWLKLIFYLDIYGSLKRYFGDLYYYLISLYRNRNLEGNDVL